MKRTQRKRTQRKRTQRKYKTRKVQRGGSTLSRDIPKNAVVINPIEVD